MSILTQTKKYKTGDAVTASVINDTIETAINANKNADVAIEKSIIAEIDSHDAKTNSHEARADSSLAKTNSVVALNKVEIMESRLNNGEFNGSNAVLVQTDGFIGFEVLDGNLMLNYSGTIAPEFSIENSDLIYKN